MACFTPSSVRRLRALQAVLQQLQIHVDAPAAGFVPQVDTQDQRDAGILDPFQLQHLFQQVQAPFQTAGVADYQDHVRQAGAEKLAGHLFFFRTGVQGIDAGQIGQQVVPAAAGEAAPGQGYGLAGPVAGVLAKAGEGIEQSAFSYVGIAHQGNDGGFGFHRVPPAGKRGVRILYDAQAAACLPHRYGRK